jgi:hypothetical protein
MKTEDPDQGYQGRLIPHFLQKRAGRRLYLLMTLFLAVGQVPVQAIDFETSSPGYAIQFTGGEHLNVTNSGTVTGNIDLDNWSTGTFTNEGINQGNIAVFNTGSFIAATVDDSGILRPGGEGAVLETFMTGNYTENSTGQMQFDVFSDLVFDQFTFDYEGHGNFQGGLQVEVANNGWDLSLGTFTLISAAATGTNSFNTNFLDNMFLYGIGAGVNANLVHNTSNQSIELVVTAVPEPGTYVLLVLGLLVVGLTVRHKKLKH